MPHYGVYKLYLDIKDDLTKNNIKMGRDAFYRFMKQNGLLVKKFKNFHKTTDSNHPHPTPENKIKNLIPTMSEQVWVTDITYIKINDNHAYLALVTDLYSKKIMGYKIDSHMKVSLTKDALLMAHKNRIHNRKNIIHHSDRGLQYCCPDYTEYARNKGMVMSTTEKYDPYENAVAERVNGILKYEFGLRRNMSSLMHAVKAVEQAVDLYNNKRRHYSLDLKTPEFAHLNQLHKHKSYSKKNKNCQEC